eukprot:CAMPEP_0167816552 /NCGR_PEP_ID=MMETSP0112_2-20121227/3675_1 /TAXON_ID=91324 /ORGANISM="Lotharella globosa, Strain CCCM811" /LENGTH=429 /DNA_ID=CAMNT_0007716163 /DNA_START=48 /DNA_END=1334 /DNA_ORIENTATION=-
MGNSCKGNVPKPAPRAEKTDGKRFRNKTDNRKRSVEAPTGSREIENSAAQSSEALSEDQPAMLFSQLVKNIEGNDVDFSLTDDSSQLDSTWEGCEVYSIDNPNSTIKFVKEFDILNFLGEGATSQVRRIKRKKDGKFYAVKIFKNKKRLVNGKIVTTEKLSLQEARLNSIAAHPDIIRIHGFLKSADKKKIMLLMELAPMGTAAEVKEPFSIAKSRRVFCHLIRAISHLHSVGISHRDIKPANLYLFDINGRCKLGDLGSAIEFEDGDDMVCSAVGTPEFLAPECVSISVNKKENSLYFSSQKADIWSAGVTLYYLVYGKLPFEGDDLIELYQSMCHDEPEYPEVPQHNKKELKTVNEIISSMLVKNPAKRVTLEELMNHKWIQEQMECLVDDAPSDFLDGGFQKPMINDFLVSPRVVALTPRAKKSVW